MARDDEQFAIGHRRRVGRTLLAVEQRDLAENLPSSMMTSFPSKDGAVITTRPRSTAIMLLPGSPL